MNRCQEYVIERLIQNHIIPEEDIEIYRFGLECLILKFIHCISYLAIAVCFDMVPHLLLIGIVFIPLRRSAGGYHARTRTGCYLFSCFYVCIILLLANAAIKESLWWLALAIADGIIFRLSPMDNQNKRLDGKETLYYRKKTRYLLIIENVSYIFLTAFHFYKFGCLVGCGICAAAFMLLIQKGTQMNYRGIKKYVLSCLGGSI